MHQPEHLTLISLFEELRGERVLLRPFQAADAEAFWTALTDSRERLLPWDTWPQRCQTLEDVQHLLACFRADFILRREMEVGIWDRTTTHFFGSIMLRPKDWQISFFELGYWLRTSAEGQGYMREAVALLVEFVFAALGAKRVMMRIDERNRRSLALAERLGFVREGCLRNSERAADGTLRNMVIMALTPADCALTSQHGSVHLSTYDQMLGQRTLGSSPRG